MGKHNESQEEFLRRTKLMSEGKTKLAMALALTPIERAYVNALLKTGHKAEAAYIASNTGGRKSKHPRSNTTYWGQRAFKIASSTRVQEYLANVDQNIEPEDLTTPVSINDVTKVLGELLHNTEIEPRDRIKAGEILLKHLGGFNKHQEARAPKQLTVINNLSPSEIDRELENISLSLSPPPKLSDEQIYDLEQEEYTEDEEYDED